MIVEYRDVRDSKNPIWGTRTTRPPSFPLPLFGLWILKRLADRGAGLDNRNLERCLQFFI